MRLGPATQAALRVDVSLLCHRTMRWDASRNRVPGGTLVSGRALRAVILRTRSAFRGSQWLLKLTAQSCLWGGFFEEAATPGCPQNAPLGMLPWHVLRNPPAVHPRELPETPALLQS